MAVKRINVMPVDEVMETLIDGMEERITMQNKFNPGNTQERGRYCDIGNQVEGLRQAAELLGFDSFKLYTEAQDRYLDKFLSENPIQAKVNWDG